MLVICVFFLCCLRKISSCASSSNATKNDESVAQQPRIRKPKRPNLGTLPQLQWSLCVSVMCHTDQHDQPLSIPGPKYAFFTVCSPDPHVSLRHPSQVSRRYDVLRRRAVQSALQNPWELGMNIWNSLTGFQYTHLWHFCIIITKPSAPAPSTPHPGDPYWCQRWWWRSAPNMNPLKNAVELLVESPLPYIIPSPYIKHPNCKPSCWIYSWLGAPKIGVVFNITLW